jgi:hypothetical protein
MFLAERDEREVEQNIIRPCLTSLGLMADTVSVLLTNLNTQTLDSSNEDVARCHPLHGVMTEDIELSPRRYGERSIEAGISWPKSPGRSPLSALLACACATHEYKPSSIFDSSTLRSAVVVCILSLDVCEEQECRQKVVVSDG